MKKYFLVVAVFASLCASSQSYHFSQFHSTPLLINPASTGYIGGTYRLATNYRTQWGGGSSPYTTTAVSFDASPLRGKLDNGNKLGLGLSYVTDQSFEGAVKSNSIAFSAAYNITLDQDLVHSLGVGLQGVYNERIVDFSKLSFENQLTGNGYDLSLPIGETLESGKKNYMDMNAGLLYNASLEDKAFFLGVGVYNILQRKASFQAGNYKMPVRYSVMLGGDIDAGERGRVYFSSGMQFQKSANEITLGAAYGLEVGEGTPKLISLGVWHRINDAIIPYLGFDLNGFKMGFSYDYTVSSIKTGGQSRNGMEFSIIYSQQDRSEMKRLVPWY